MNRARALIIFSACSVLALSAVAYIKHAEDSTTRLAANPALTAAKSEVTSLSTKADESPGKDATEEKIAALSTELQRFSFEWRDYLRLLPAYMLSFSYSSLHSDAKCCKSSR